MKTYQYRLTITFKTGMQWRIGVDTTIIGDSVAREMGKNVDVLNICFSDEKTGRIEWFKSGADFQVLSGPVRSNDGQQVVEDENVEDPGQ